jgi:hypothetical protein
MAQKSYSVGANKMVVYDVDSSIGTVGTELFVFDKTRKSDITGHPIQKNLKISPDSVINTPALETFLQSKLSSAAGDSTVEEKYEDGSKETFVGITDTTKKVAVIWYGGNIGTQRETIRFIGYLTGDTGTKSIEPNKPVSVKVEFSAIVCDKVYTFATALWATTLVSAASKTLATDEYGKVEWLATP